MGRRSRYSARKKRAVKPAARLRSRRTNPASTAPTASRQQASPPPLRRLFPFDLNASNFKSAMVFLGIFAITLFIMLLIAVSIYHISSISLTALGSAALEFALLFSVLEYLFLYKHMTRGEVTSSLGIGKAGLSLKNVGIGILIFLVLLAIEIFVGVISSVTGANISTNVQLLLASEPLWFYVFTFTITPLCEEALFRGMMVPRIGIIVSALLFGLSHSSYDSTFGIDMLVAFIFGVIAGWAFKRTKSLYPSIIAHGLVNLLAVAAFLF